MKFGIDTAFNTVVTSAMMSELDFVIPRIGTLGYGQTGTTNYYYKNLSVDGGFAQTIANAQANGVATGCYIFSYAWNVTAAIAEANKVCDALDNLGIDLSIAVFFDWERTGYGTQGSYEMVTAAGVTVTPTLVRNMTIAFMETCESRGRRSGWYQSAGDTQEWWTTAIVEENRNLNRFFWLAQWASSYSYDCDIWQYQGDVYWNGIGVDKNYAINDRIFDDSPIIPHPPKNDLLRKIILFKTWNGIRRFDRWKF